MSSALHPVHVRIRNFQSIEDLEFEVRGFTCITGRTNIGKSAIMRAISRSLLNDPVTGMVRKGQKFASVEMHSDGWGFLWEKGEKDVNRYQIDGKTFDKTGQVQLKEVQEMGFRSIAVGDDELEPWWAPQTRPLFLLDKSGPQITNFISEVSRLKVYQDAIVLAARSKRKHTDVAREKAEELGRAQARLQKLGPLESLEKLEAEIEEQINSLQEYAQKALTLEQLHRDMERIADLLRRTKQASELRVKADVEDAAEKVRRVVELARCHQALEKTAKRIISVKPVDSVKLSPLPTEEVERLRKLARCLRIVPLRAFVDKSAPVAKMGVPDLSEAVRAAGQLRQVFTLSRSIERKRAALSKLDALPAAPSWSDEDVQRLRKLHKCWSRIVELRANIEAADQEEARLVAMKKKAEKKLAALQVCPECGQKIPDEHTTKKRRALSA
jgi:predicted ATPase